MISTPSPSHGQEKEEAQQQQQAQQQKTTTSPTTKPNNNNKPKLGQAVKNVGKVLSQNEAKKAAKQTGKSVQQVMVKALDKGVGLEAKVVNNYTPAPRQKPAVTKALAPLANLQMKKGTAYYGSSTTKTPSTYTRALGWGVNYTPGSTTYNPIVLPRSVVSGVQRVPAGAPATAKAGNGRWGGRKMGELG